jgi:tripartite-type tricarboxylate transporter receptor subunit TctC
MLLNPKEVPMKRILGLALAASVIITEGDAAAQANYPEKAIRIIVGFPAGSSPDIAARLLGQKFAESWAKSVVVENVPGAAGNIATERVARAAPDGHTLALAVNAQVITNPSLYKLPYDPVRDFAPVSQVSVSPSILVVHTVMPAKTLRELVALAKARPGEITFASGGSGSSPHVAAELLKSVAGIDILHIPYKGVIVAVPDLLAGRVMMMFSPISVVLPLVRDGKLRPLAVTSLRRSPVAPEVPTIDESGYPGFEATVWYGLLAPAGTAATIVRKVHLETVKVLALPDVRAKLGDLGMEVIGNSPEEFARAIKSEIPKWAILLRESGIKAD